MLEDFFLVSAETHLLREKVKILIVDDLEENLFALEALIRNPELDILKAKSGNQALDLLLEHDFALALVDVQMPLMDGFELAELMRSIEKTKSVPIIFVTAGSRNQERLFKGYESGAVDFLYKPLDPLIIKNKVNVFFKLDLQKKILEAQLKELSKHEKALQASQEHLKKALQIREEFLSIASHELNTPLTPLKLHVQMLAREIKKSNDSSVSRQKMEKFLHVSDRQITRLSKLVDELLDVSRISNGKLSLQLQSLNLVEVVDEVLDHFHEQITSSNCHFTLTKPDKLMGFWDRDRIVQVITNLVSNALKYGNGKPIQFHLYQNQKQNLAEFSIQDFGLGIDSKDQQRIFEKFERATRCTSGINGLGLGLYIVKEIIAAHGGKITVESELGKGSLFKVRLPLALKSAS